MSKFKCSECGSDISMAYTTPIKCYDITDEDNFKRADSNIGKDDPFCEFFCEAFPLHHDIGDSIELNKWKDKIITKFYWKRIKDKCPSIIPK